METIALRNQAKAAAKAKQAAIDAEKKAAEAKAKADKKIAEDAAKAQADKDAAAALALRDLQQENALLMLTDAKEIAMKELEIAKQKELDALAQHENFAELKHEIDKKYKKKQEDLNKAVVVTEEQLAAAKEGIYNNTRQLAGRLAGENKALQAGLATIDTWKAVTGALSDPTPLPYYLKVANAASAGAMGIMNVKKILSTDVGNGGGGGITPSIDAGQQAPNQNFVGGSFDLSGGNTQQPIEAFVVTDNLTNSQDKLSNIRRRATI